MGVGYLEKEFLRHTGSKARLFVFSNESFFCYPQKLFEQILMKHELIREHIDGDW